MANKLVKFLKMPAITTNGTLVQLQSPDIPFEIKRVYFVYGVSVGSVRGAHTHKRTLQALFCIQGKITLVIDNGRRRERILLDKPEVGILLEPGVWHEMQDFQKDTIVLVLASEKYEPEDYIRSYEDFLNNYARG